VLDRLPLKKVARFCCLIFMLSIVNCSINIPSAMAANASSSFQDVPNSHWALKNITKLNVRQVITGYDDGSFRPDRQVSQLEALLMAVRNMGQEEMIAAVDDTRSLTISVPDWATAKYKKELLYAVQQGLIVPSENNFNASAQASRAWITQLMVRMIGKNSEAAALSNQTPAFTDFADIPRWALGYVNVGLKYSLIAGFPDNTMKPLQSVTRAQAATMLSNSQPYLDLSAHIIEGTIINLAGSTVTVSVSGIALNLYIHDKTVLFGASSNLIEASELSINDNVELIPHDSQIEYLAVLSEGSSNNSIIGTVLHTVSSQKLIVVRDSQDKVYSNTWDNTSSCIDQTGRSYDFENILPGTQVQLTLNSRGVILTTVVYNTNEIGVYDGIIYDLVTEQQLIILKDSSDSFSSYLYGSDLVVIISGMRFPSVNDLQVGDEVKVTVNGSYINKIELLKAKQELTLTGKVVVIEPETSLLVVNAQGTLYTFTAAEDVIITIPGLTDPLLADIMKDDQVELIIEEGRLMEITVFNSSVLNNT